jgi:hypothetical protein
MSPEYQALLQRLREQHTLEEVERIEATYCQVWPDPARRLEMLRFVVERLDSQSRRPTWNETVNWQAAPPARVEARGRRPRLRAAVAGLLQDAQRGGG